MARAQFLLSTLEELHVTIFFYVKLLVIISPLTVLHEKKNQLHQILWQIQSTIRGKGGELLKRVKLLSFFSAHSPRNFLKFSISRGGGGFKNVLNWWPFFFRSHVHKYKGRGVPLPTEFATDREFSFSHWSYISVIYFIETKFNVQVFDPQVPWFFCTFFHNVLIS